MAEKKVTQKDVEADRASVAKQVGADEDRGYVGRTVDPTPNEHYTLQGVTSGKPTPETDAKQFEKAQQSIAADAADRSS